MKDAMVLLIQSTVRHVLVDDETQLDDFMKIAAIRGFVLCSPNFFLLKSDQPLKTDKNGVFMALKLP
jgi:hypothetical protein